MAGKEKMLPAVEEIQGKLDCSRRSGRLSGAGIKDMSEARIVNMLPAKRKKRKQRKSKIIKQKKTKIKK